MKRHFWFVAAGTGGHIFPGLAVAKNLNKSKNSENTFLFWGDQSRLEARLIPEAGFPIKFLNVEQWKGKSPFKKMIALFGVGISFLKVFFESFLNKPDALISVGGYVSVPVAMAAKIRSVPIFIIEPNCISGVANALVSQWSVEAYVSPVMPQKTRLRCRLVELGNPVREGLPSANIKNEAQKILVLGGSQGATVLAKVTVDVAKRLFNEGYHLSWTIQAGEKNLSEIKNYVDQQLSEKEISVVSFINHMNEVYQASDVLISRAGATTLAEACVVGIPTILVPFPFAADDHQRVNATFLENAGAALCVEEKSDEFETNLYLAVLKLVEAGGGFNVRRTLSENMKSFARPRASADIANSILKNIEAR